jgi:hypothetical protein
MHLSLRRGIPRLIPVLSVAALLAVCSTSFAAGTSSSTTPNLGGTWSGRYRGTYSGTFTIHWRQTASGSLKGSIRLSNPPGTYRITGKVRRGAISFGVVAAGATYTGSVSGKSMSGHYKTARGGGSWSAHKTS